MNFGQIIHNFNPDVQHIIWKLERYNKKLNKQNLSVDFNKICLNGFLLPKYTLYIMWNIYNLKVSTRLIF